MSKKIDRNYLEIKSIKDLRVSRTVTKDHSLEKVEPADFQLNKFFYKNIGKDHRWVDRLVWTDKQWTEYVSDKKVKTYIIKKSNNLAGYFELIFHDDQNEVEIAYLGLLTEFQNQKLGSYLLSSAIKESFSKKTNRVWVHTCSLDHKHALNNYLSRGMKVFQTEIINL